MEAVKQRYYWPGYEGDIQKRIAECASFQQRNALQPAGQAPLGTISARQNIMGYYGPIATNSPREQVCVGYN